MRRQRDGASPTGGRTWKARSSPHRAHDRGPRVGGPHICAPEEKLRREVSVVPRKGFEPPTPALRTKNATAPTALSQVVSKSADPGCSVLVHPNPGRPQKSKPPPDPKKRSPGAAGTATGAKAKAKVCKPSTSSKRRRQAQQKAAPTHARFAVTSGTESIGRILRRGARFFSAQ
jgi:hypothetical protein